MAIDKKILAKYDHICFSSQDYHRNAIPLIENSCFQIFMGSREEYFKFYHLITEWLEQSYLSISVVNDKFRSFLMLAKKYRAHEHAFARIFQGLLNGGFHQKGKNVK